MATKRAKAFIHGTKERKRIAAAQKQNVYITDRITAKKAKTYVYGHREAKRLAAVLDMNVFIDECMTCLPPKPAPITTTADSNSYSYWLTFSLWCMSVYVLYTVSGLIFNYRV
jgi:hypothetical protein